MSLKTEQALQKFDNGFNCAQSVFFSFCNDVGIDTDTALRISCGFGGGLGRKGEVCGAVTGGIMVLGAKFGHRDTADSSATETTYQKTQELITRFAAEFGTVRCKELLNGVDLCTNEGQRTFSSKDLKKNICTPCIAHVVTIVESLLA